MGSTVDGRSLRYAGRRDELLDGAASWVLENGLDGLSLRALARDLGISHRTLLHHFPNKQQLVGEVLRELRARSVKVLMEQVDLAGVEDQRALIEHMWEHFAAPENLPFHRLFFEAYGASLCDPGRYAPYFEGFESDWSGAIAAILVRGGTPRSAAGVLATMVVAGYRGLLLDLLVTGDRARTRAALGRLAELVATAATSGS